MKAIIKFNLPEEHFAHLRAAKALDMASVLKRITELWKDYEDVGEDEPEASWHTVKRDILEIFEDYGINVDELNA
jgi:hypothetical protein